MCDRPFPPPDLVGKVKLMPAPFNDRGMIGVNANGSIFNVKTTQSGGPHAVFRSPENVEIDRRRFCFSPGGPPFRFLLRLSP